MAISSRCIRFPESRDTSLTQSGKSGGGTGRLFNALIGGWSTVAYFTMHGLSEAGAMKETRRIKPALSSGAQFAITKRLLNALAEIGAGGDGQR